MGSLTRYNKFGTPIMNNKELLLTSFDFNVGKSSNTLNYFNNVDGNRKKYIYGNSSEIRFSIAGDAARIDIDGNGTEQIDVIDVIKYSLDIDNQIMDMKIANYLGDSAGDIGIDNIRMTSFGMNITSSDRILSYDASFSGKRKTLDNIDAINEGSVGNALGPVVIDEDEKAVSIPISFYKEDGITQILKDLDFTSNEVFIDNTSFSISINSSPEKYISGAQVSNANDMSNDITLTLSYHLLETSKALLLRDEYANNTGEILVYLPIGVGKIMIGGVNLKYAEDNSQSKVLLGKVSSMRESGNSGDINTYSIDITLEKPIGIE